MADRPKGFAVSVDTFYDPLEARREEIESLSKALQGLAIIAFIFLLLALGIWAFVWYRNRGRQVYRYVMLLFLFGSCLLALMFQRFSDKFIYHQTMQQIIIFTITGLAVLCLFRALNQIVSTAQVVLCALTIVLVAFFLNGLEEMIAFTMNDFSDNASWVMNLILVNIPKMVSLVVGLVVTGVLAYSLFFLDNSKYREHRDYKIIRYTSVSLMILLVYCLGTEIQFWVWQYAPDLPQEDQLYHVYIQLVLVSLRDIMFCILLCFLDLEVIGLAPCINLDSDQEEDRETKPLTDAADEPKVEVTYEIKEETFVSSYETDLPPRPIAEAKPSYGAVPSSS